MNLLATMTRILCAVFVHVQRPESGEVKLASFQDTVEATLMFVESYLMMHRRNEVCFVACTARERWEKFCYGASTGSSIACTPYVCVTQSTEYHTFLYFL